LADGYDCLTLTNYGCRSIEMKRLALRDAPLEAAFVIQGLSAERLLRGEEGTHLIVPPNDALFPIAVNVWRLNHEDEAKDVLQQKRAERTAWLTRLQRGEATPEQDPQPLGPIVRTSTADDWVPGYEMLLHTVDLRTELTGMWNSAGYLASVILAGLELPRRLRE
jgi:hypothetical protein